MLAMSRRPTTASPYANLPTAYNPAELSTSSHEMHDRALQDLANLLQSHLEASARKEKEEKAKRDLAIAKAMAWLSEHSPTRDR
ncbi:hypothetical protein MNV49_004919 [Pseudohyphozyma bogoriensis]|nr:hypothetical protein MNV49_004919 [Pseudohyphozyma bogoriensis]